MYHKDARLSKDVIETLASDDWDERVDAVSKLEIAVIEWIYWYNASRLHGEIGDIPPAEYELDWYLHHAGDITAENH